MADIPNEIRRWMAACRTSDGGLSEEPITLHTTSGSMQPVLRVHIDTAFVYPCRVQDADCGDIVLVAAPGSPAGVLLHRLRDKKSGYIRTVGDYTQGLDGWLPEEALLGKVRTILGPQKEIDCTAFSFRMKGWCIAKFWRTHRAIEKIKAPLRRVWQRVR